VEYENISSMLNVLKIFLLEVWALALKLQCLYEHSFRKSRTYKDRTFSEIIFGCMHGIVLNLYGSCFFLPLFVLFILIIWFLIPMFKVDLTAYVEKHEFCFDAVLNEHVTNDEVTCLHSYEVWICFLSIDNSFCWISMWKGFVFSFLTCISSIF